ncbi:ribosomal protein S18-alanine N-acetyltransferase [Methylophilus sp. DW102]|uniref:ribosomal protein S18-alanine N-acetyltransferase n=1 Tax=Methylophilus sp. DW102 TaxID=3095607 RepID=UPI00308DE718|nr:ribosomal protein S18-alanine N-acetyltransferase [Methylophilus sp. DW102]
MSALPHSQPSFRPMTEQDLSAVMRIEPTIYSHPWTLGNFRDSLNAGHSAWVMELAGELVGYALVMMVLDEAHLLNISVAKPFQGQGFGRALLAQMIAISRRYQAANMFLEVRVSNASAIALYEALGFCEMGIRRNYYPTKSGREDAVLMGLAL